MVSIPMAPPPKVRLPENFSAAFNDVLAKMLTKDPAQRPDANELMKHPFIIGAVQWKDEIKKRVAAVLNPDQGQAVTPDPSTSTMKAPSDTVIVKNDLPISAPINKGKINTQLPAELNGVKKIVEDARHESDQLKLRIKELEEQNEQLIFSYKF